MESMRTPSAPASASPPVAATSHTPGTRAAGISGMSLAVAMLMSGTIGYLVRESGASPAVAVLARCVIGGGALLAVVLMRAAWRRQLRACLCSRAGLLIALSGMLLTGNWLLLFTAFAHLSVGVATVIFHVEPFLLVILGAVLLGERLTRRTLALISVGFGGLVLVAQPWSGAGPSGSSGVGIALALAAALLYALSIILVRRVQARTQVRPHPLVLVVIQLAAGALVALPFLGGPAPAVGSLSWGHLLVLGLVDTAGLYVLVYASYPALSTAWIGVLAFVYPAAAVVVDLLAYGTRISPMQALGFLAIAAAGIGQAVSGRGPQDAAARRMGR